MHGCAAQPLPPPGGLQNQLARIARLERMKREQASQMNQRMQEMSTALAAQQRDFQSGAYLVRQKQLLQQQQQQLQQQQHLQQDPSEEEHHPHPKHTAGLAGASHPPEGPRSSKPAQAQNDESGTGKGLLPPGSRSGATASAVPSKTMARAKQDSVPARRDAALEPDDSKARARGATDVAEDSGGLGKLPQGEVPPCCCFGGLGGWLPVLVALLGGSDRLRVL